MPRPPSSPPCHQLPLPLPLPTGPAPPALPPDAATQRARQVWRTLPPSTQTQVRQAIRRILLEVPHDAVAEPGQDHRPPS
jgi:hypothetical protein